MQEIQEAKKKGSDKKKKRDKNDPENIKNYLEFVSFLASERLSYEQIHRIGSFLKKKAQNQDLDFLATHYFEPEFLSKLVSECFRPNLLQELHEDISKFKYSF